MTLDTPPKTGAQAMVDVRRIPSPTQRALWMLLRLAVTLHTALTFLQAILAGSFLNGDFDALHLHRSNGIAVGVTGVAQVVVALLARFLGRAPTWPIFVSLFLVSAETLQIHSGFARVLAIHVPLGVAIIVATSFFLANVWRRSFQPRSASPKERSEND